MKNITLAVDDAVLEEVRVYAAKRQTSVNALVRNYLGQIASEEGRITEARKGLRELIANSSARLGPDYRWNREELYEDRVLPRHEHPALRGGSEAERDPKG